MAESSREAQQEKQTPTSRLSPDHQQKSVEPESEVKPCPQGPSGPPGDPGGPGGGNPFGPGMGPPVEYPKGLKLYSIIVPLYFTTFLTALV
jgi:hypothetical protein